ncbi:MAG: carbohydrate ABC transporter permease [Acidimicrobiales bacterium]
MKTRRRLRLASRYALLTFAAIVVVIPIYTAVVLATQPGERLFDFPAVLFPRSIEFSTFREAIEAGSLPRYMLNSAVVSSIIVAGQIVTSVLAGYAFACLRFPAKRWIFLAFLATHMIPAEVTIVANYETMQRLGWIDTFPALTVPFLASAFGTFLLRQVFLQVPQELRDAASLDGYGHIGFLWNVAIPLARPAIAALGLFSFLAAWNQYLWPLLVTNNDSHRTVQIGLKALASTNLDRINLVMAGTVVASLPIVVLLLIFQRQLIRGLTAGAVKG